MFFKTSAGVILFSFRVSIALLTKYTASTAPYMIRYRYVGNSSTIEQATFATKLGYMLSMMSLVKVYGTYLVFKVILRNTAAQLVGVDVFHRRETALRPYIFIAVIGNEYQPEKF